MKRNNLIKKVCKFGAAMMGVIIPLMLTGCEGKEKTTQAASTAETPELTAPTPVTSQAAATGPAAEVQGAWVPVVRGTVKDFVPAVGSFQPRQRTTIGSQVSGRVLEVLVDVGDRVKKGQELVRLDPAFFQIECQQNKAMLDGAIIARQDAEINYTRMKNLWEKPGNEPPSISKKLYDDAKLLYNRACSKVNEAQAAMSYSKQRYAESVIRSPYDGVVTRRMVDPGEPVTAAPTTYLLELQEVDTLELDFSLPQKMLASVGKGDEFEFTVEGIDKGTGCGTIAVVFPTIDENTRSFKCRAYIDNARGRFCAGLLANVRVVDRVAKDVLTLPRRTLTQTATGWQVSVLENGKRTLRDVEVGIMMDERVEIRSGLTPGENVLVVEEGN